MSVSSRDLSILKHINEYCVQIEEAVSRFGQDQALFLQDDVYHNAVALCILQLKKFCLDFISSNDILK